MKRECGSARRLAGALVLASCCSAWAASQEEVDEAFAAWRDQIARADAWLDTQDDATMAEELSFNRHGRTATKREVLVHLIEEYARHCGHADLLRERIDGRTGV